MIVIKFDRFLNSMLERKFFFNKVFKESWEDNFVGIIKAYSMITEMIQLFSKKTKGLFVK